MWEPPYFMRKDVHREGGKDRQTSINSLFSQFCEHASEQTAESLLTSVSTTVETHLSPL